MPALLDRLKDDDAGVRDAAATALGDVLQASAKMDKDDLRRYWSDAEPVLRNALTNESDPRALRGALYAVGSFGPEAAPLADQVRPKLKDKEAPTRQNAAWALGRMGEKAAGAVDDLIALLQDKNALVRRDAATALGDIGAKEAAKPLLSLVEHEDDDVVRRTALEKLIPLVSAKNKDAAQSLYKLLDNEDPDTAHLAAFVLANIGGDEAKPAVKVLRAALKDAEPEDQRLAAAALANLGPIAAPAVPDLGTVLRTSKDTELRRNCAIALGHVGAEAKAAVPDLVAVLQSDAPLVLRHFSAEALAKMQYPANTKALPDVLKVLAKDEPYRREGDYDITGIRQRCIWCFFNVDQLPKDAIDVFTAILDEKGDDTVMVRYDAARILATRLGEEAPDKAADWLLDMLRNERLNIYYGTNTNVNSGGSEAASGSATVAAKKGGDARYLAANALGFMGRKASSRDDIVKELKKAAAEAKDDKLKQEAQTALKRLRVQ